MKRLLILCFLVAAGLFAQISYPPGVVFVPADPTGACASIWLPLEWSNATNKLFYCSGSPGTWTAVTSAGIPYTLPTATNVALGGVTMSTATSSVAAATDDPRLQAIGVAGPAGPAGPPGPGGENGAPGTPGYSPNTLLSGGAVIWTSGYNFIVSSTTYVIGNTQYNAPSTNITLTAPSGTPGQDRIDVVVANSSGAIAVIEGSTGATPAQPDIDPATQLFLSFVLVSGASSQPAAVASTNIYQEDTGPAAEWTTTKCAGCTTTFTLNSGNNPFAGSIDIETTLATTNQYVNFQAAATFDTSISNYLVFYIRVKTSWANNRQLQLRLMNGATARGSIVTLSNGAFGFSNTNLATYQQIVIPLSLFATNSAVVDTLRITVAGNGTNMGFYLDAITLQSGLPQPYAPAYMSWKGTWNATVNYSVNDVVISSSVPYVALSNSTNSAPPSANWSALATLTRGFGGSFDGGGSALTAGKTIYTTVPFACTVVAWNITVDAGTATVDVWRLATGTAIPVAGNSITGTGAGRPAIAANTAIHSTTLTGWSSIAIAKNDIIGVNLQAVATATYVNLLVECQQ